MININDAYKLAEKKYPKVKFDHNGYYESKDIFVIDEDPDEIPKDDRGYCVDDGYIVVIDKNKGFVGCFGLTVFTDEFLDSAVYWEKKNGKWTSIPAIETFG